MREVEREERKEQERKKRKGKREAGRKRGRRGVKKIGQGTSLEVKQLRLYTFIARHAGSIHG